MQKQLEEVDLEPGIVGPTAGRGQYQAPYNDPMRPRFNQNDVN